MPGEAAKSTIRNFITTTLLNDSDYPLTDDDPLITGGLIDIAALKDLAEFLNETFGLHLDEADLSTENIETVSAIMDYIEGHVE